MGKKHRTAKCLWSAAGCKHQRTSAMSLSSAPMGLYKAQGTVTDNIKKQHFYLLKIVLTSPLEKFQRRGILSDHLYGADDLYGRMTEGESWLWRAIGCREKKMAARQ